MKTIFSLLSISLASVAFQAAAQTYVYDDADRLEKVIYPTGQGVAYTYDSRDNLTQVNAIAVPPAVTNIAISWNSSFEAALTWQHSGDALLYLIQSKLKGTDDWVNGASIDDVDARSATLDIAPGVERLYRIVVYGAGGETSAPSAAVALPSQSPILVTTLADENDHVLGRGLGDSLREAIEVAIDGETIEFAPYLTGGQINLKMGELTIAKGITIDARNLPGRVTIDANSASRIFSVSGTGTVALKGLLMREGDSSFGGALINNRADLTLEECVISLSISPDYGGGIYNWNGGTLLLTETTVTGNISPYGGGVFNSADSSVETRFSTLSHNSATDGGGIYNAQGLLFIDRSTLSANEATQNGGAIFNSGPDALIVNSTIAGNASADNLGGGISNNGSAALTLRHVTLAANTGTGILNNGSALLTLDNAIVANNFNPLNAPYDLVGNYAAIGANIVRVHDGSLLSGPAALEVDPLLGPFGSYGGRSHSMPPLVGSPALDAGIVTADTPSTDQDNSFRPHGDAPELGSIESRLSSETNLEWLTTSAGPLDPVFRPSQTGYTASVPAETTTVAFRAAKGNNGQTIEIRTGGGEFIEVESKEASSAIPLASGENTIEVRVTAQNGNSTETYSITVVRGTPSLANADLTSLGASAGTLSPSFDATVFGYHSVVSENTASTNVTATPFNSSAKMEVRANFGEYAALLPGIESASLPLATGANAIDIRTTAADGATTSLSSITVTREPIATSNALLAALTTSAGPLGPNFSRGLFHYEVTVPDNVPSVTVSGITAQVPASIKARINGGAYAPLASGATSGQLQLEGGDNLIELEVTAQDGATAQVYSIVVTQISDDIDWISQAGDGTSTKASLSADGRFVAFASRAKNLVPGDTNNQEDVFVYDRIEGTMRLLSKNASGQLGDRSSTDPAISADGKFVAFQSEARNLVPNDNNGGTSPSAGRDIFVYDLTLDTIERVSLPDNGGEANQQSGEPAISGDGRYVAFQSAANNLVSGFAVSNNSVYIRDRQENTTVGISVPFADIGANRDSLSPAMSSDGKYIAFEFSVGKNADNQNLNYNYTDIYLYSTLSGAVERITGTKIGVEADGTRSEAPSISADGRYIAFESDLEDIDFYDTNSAVDVFVYDRVEGTTRRVSANGATGAEAFRESTNPALSGDGRFVAFESMASNLVDSDTNDAIDIFITELATGEITRASVNDDGEQGDGYSYLPSLSYHGNAIAFQSQASNMVPDQTGSFVDIFVKETKPIAPSSNAGLVGLTTNLGPLQRNETSVDATVSEALGSIVLRPTLADAGATIRARVNAAAPVNLAANAESTLSLAAGENVIELAITAADGTTSKSYTLTIARTFVDDAYLSDANLATLSTSAGALSPTFASELRSYAAIVPFETARATISPTLSENAATVAINGSPVSSGSPSEIFDLEIGSNVFITTVTARNGITSKTYAIAITRLPAEAIEIEETIPITGVEFLNDSPPKLRITWQSTADAVYLIESSTGLRTWLPTGSEIVSEGETTATEIELDSPTPSTIFLRLKIK